MGIGLQKLLQRNFCVPALLLTMASVAAHAAPWFALGPYGGTARSFGTDPSDSRHLYLGTTSGWIYESHDAGASWTRLTQLGTSDNLVIGRLLVDPKNPKHLLVGAYKFDQPDGGIFISNDAGKNWYVQAQMRGQSVRSIARSASDPNELAAGTLQGVFLSKDAGTHWAQISPVGSTELHEVESLAIDPVDPNVIYAGTWHLPWKTTDGGVTWNNIKQGIADDSDVFSIIVDPTHPQTVYASACSGIYKSINGGDQFAKLQREQGIPTSAERTRRLLQDPTQPNIVFAGTTEGLYRTKNAGASFKLVTDPDVIVNDVYVDPAHPEHVLLATDRGGVLSSDDGGDTFAPSNTGFSARQVLAYAADAQNPGTIYVGVVSDKTTGGVFQSLDGGVQWKQQSSGLGGRDVFSLASTASGVLLAGTSHGVYRLETGMWTLSDSLENAGAASADVAATAAPPALQTEPAPHRDAAPLAESKNVRPAPNRPTSVRAGSSSRPKPKPTSSRTRTAVQIKTGPIARTTRTRTDTRNRSGVRRVVAKVPSQRAPAPQRTRSLHLPPASAPVVAPPAPMQRMDAIVYGMLPSSDSVYAATSSGLWRSTDDAHHWSAVTSLSMSEVRFIAGQKNMVLAGGLRRLALSVDNGATWDTLALPSDLTQLSAMAVDELGNLWAGGAEGVYYSTDLGLTWKTLRNLFLTEVDGIFFDAANHRMLVTSSNSTITFAAHLPDYKVSFWETGWHLRFVRPVGDHLIGATLYDGMVLQPRMVAAEAEKASTSAVPLTTPATEPSALMTPPTATVVGPKVTSVPNASPAASSLPPTPPTKR